MAIKTKVQLEAENDANITTNGNNDITGAILNALVTNLIDSLEIIIQSYTTVQIAALTATLRQIVFNTDTNTFQYYDGTRWVEFGHPKYKVYSALLTQTGTNAPTATVLENTIGAIVWARSATGIYTATLSTAFTSNKTWYVLTNNIDETHLYRIDATSTSVVTVWSFQAGGSPTDGELTLTPIEIRVYY
jgi:hypothetical protein